MSPAVKMICLKSTKLINVLFRIRIRGLSKIPSKGMEQKRGEETQKFKKEGG